MNYITVYNDGPDPDLTSISIHMPLDGEIEKIETEDNIKINVINHTTMSDCTRIMIYKKPKGDQICK